MGDEKEVYAFNIVIGFMTEAENRHDALRNALNAEASLNEASLTGSYGRDTTIRTRAPEFKNFRRSRIGLPKKGAVTRPMSEAHARFIKFLEPLKHDYMVRLKHSWRDTEFTYDVRKPTAEQAVEEARLMHYHETSDMTPTLISVEEKS